MSAARSFQMLVAAALLGGCMIPQPDTPPIGPPSWSQQVNKATPPPTPEATGGAAMAPAAPSAAPSVAADATLRLATRLVGRIVGADASRITAVPTREGLPGVLVTPDREGSFVLELAGGGTYRIELTIGERTVVATPAIELAQDGEKQVVITVAGDPPVATVRPAE